MTTSVLIKPYTDNITTGVRLVDSARDAAAIVDLVAIGFGRDLDPQGQKRLRQMQRAAHWSMWATFLFGPTVDPTGLVYVVDGKVVGNLSLRHAYPYKRKGRLIGNVVVHPDYQGRGIGHALLTAALDTARAQSARWVGLEVREDYAIAKHLYTQAGFVTVGRIHHLLRPQGIPWPDYALPQRQWYAGTPQDGALWNRLAASIYTQHQKWVLEIRPRRYAFGGWNRRFDLWFSGERERVWLHKQETLRLALRVKTEKWHHFHLWDMLLHPDDAHPNTAIAPHKSLSGTEETIAQALQTTRRFPTWPVIALVADQPHVVAQLKAVGFVSHRTLVQMILQL